MTKQVDEFWCVRQTYKELTAELKTVCDELEALIESAERQPCSFSNMCTAGE